MTERKEVNACELCGEKPAATLCPECSKCYCRACSEFVHKEDSEKDHKTEIIPEGVVVNAACPLHKGALELFCVDEAKLCCSACKEDKLHKGHRMVDIAEIAPGSSLFSVEKVREGVEDAMRRGDALGRKIGETIESIDRNIAETKEKIRKLFEEEHKKLWDEESRLMDELERRSNDAKEALMDNLNTLEEIREYSSVLNEAYAGVTSDGCSKLMKLNIVSEIEKQRDEVGKVLRAEMRDLGVRWDEKARKVSFTRRLFSGAPSVKNVAVNAVSWREVEVSWDISCEEKSDGARYTVGMKREGERQWKVVKNLLVDRKCSVGDLKEGSAYEVRVKCVAGETCLAGEWSDVVVYVPSKSKEDCVWRECPSYVGKDKKYVVNEKNPRIAIKINDGGYGECTIVGNTFIPPNAVTSWSVKILESKENGGNDIFIGIVPSDINQNKDYNYESCGWYLGCYRSELWSGPPHNYRGKEYGPGKKDGEYVRTGDSVGVVMDTTKGDLSFIVNGVDLGLAFKGIPLDKPLVPCVLLCYQGDSVELDTSDVKEIVDSSIPVPSNIITESSIWDSITLTWDEVSDASFYQVEVDGNKSWYENTANTFAKRGLLPETEHSFRVRTVRGSSVSEWSDVVKGRTPKESFETSAWKKCPEDVYEKRKYVVDEKNPRIATKVNGGWDEYYAIIGNTPIPLNKVTSWSIKVLRSRNNNGDDIFIGISPSDINQNTNYNYNKCGWHFYCGNSSLCSGPPHNYRWKEYGPRKGDGEYMHAGDAVGVVMDTAKGDLSFVLNDVNLGVAYEEIPFDKPLVPCVLLGYRGGSVGLDTSEMKENVNSSIPIPSNITVKCITWDTITLTWDEVNDASFYQIEMDGNKSWYANTENTFTKRVFLSEIEHSFRVRTVRGNSVSEWSSVVNGRIPKKLFETSWWEKCLGYVDEGRKYSVDEKNLRIATKINDDGYCTIIGNTPISPRAVTSWSVKILESRENGCCIYIGIAPSYIDQKDDYNYKKCGWYFNCYDLTLCSGLPHEYRNKEYGARKGLGKYARIGDSVGVVMDATNGELSFALNGVNLGIAYERIPLDKPLSPCVLLGYGGDSVELII